MLIVYGFRDNVLCPYDHSKNMNNKNNAQINTSDSGLAKRVLRIQQGEESPNPLISEYIPFIKSSVYKSTGRHISKESDEMSIGLLAFNEAINSYNPQRGAFLSFANWVIKRRIIDYLRKTEKHRKETNFADLSEKQHNEILEFEANNYYTIENPLKLEIDALSLKLKEYHIVLEDLVLVSPKAHKTKNACIKTVKYILEHPEVYAKMQKHYRLPIKNIEINLKIPRKLLNRHRKYIITVVEILSGDYVYLREYVAFYEEGVQK